MKKILVWLCLFLCSYASADSAKAYQRLKETTVRIAVGTGFIIQGYSQKKYLLTNWHVCKAGQWEDRMEATYEDGTIIVGPIVKKDPLVDLCASTIQINPKSLRISDSLRLGQIIYTRGYPERLLTESEGKYVGISNWVYEFAIEEVGECFPGSRPSYSGRGNIRACRVSFLSNVTTLYSRPGSSGSPVVNSDGDLVGVISSWDSENDTAGMVTLEQIKSFMKGL